ncbi:MAG: XdhC family protein [Gemmatimonadaceae bacterium]
MNSVLVGDGTSLSAILQAVRNARAARPSVRLALATLVNVEGSSYRQPGARLLVDAEQRVLAGAISGGCLEGDVAARAAEVCQTNAPIMLRYDLREDLETIWGFGAGCDGIAHVLLEPLADVSWLQNAHDAMMRRTRPVLVTVFGSTNSQAALGEHELVEYTAVSEQPMHIKSALATGQPCVGVELRGGDARNVLSEPLNAPVALHLIGAGRSAEAFATIASAMGWHVTVIDHRPALLADLKLPDAVRRVERWPEQGLNDLPVDGRTVVALLTHIFETDVAWLQKLLASPLAYIGVLGSRNRAARLIEQLTTDGFSVTDEMLRCLFAPIGLDLGGETPESIALAGVAEMEAVLHERPGGFLRSRQSPIHTRTPVPLVVTDAIDATLDSCVVLRDQRDHPV